MTTHPNSGRREFLKTSSLALASIPFLDFNIKAEVTHQNQVCIFSKHLHWLNWKEVGEFSKGIGFDGIDLTVRKGGHVDPEKAEELLPKAVEEIKASGIDVPMMATDINDADDPLTEKILKTASESGIRNYRMAYYHYDPGIEIMENLKLFRIKMEKLANLNAKYNICGAYQNHAGNYVGASIWDIFYLVNELDRRYIGCQFDPRHAVAEGGQSWQVDMKLIKDYINCSVMKDFIWEKNDNKWDIKNVPLGEGMVDFDLYLRLYNDFELSGPISLHIEYPMFPEPEDQFNEEEKNKLASDILKKELSFIRNHLKSAGITSN